MRLEQYLTEEYSPEEVIKMVRKDCSEALNAMIRTHNALWRGSDDSFSGYIKAFTPRTDRRPRDTKKWVHDILDEEFEKKFGWKVRSEAAFATASKSVADGFGNRAYMFFPFDGFEIVWSDKVSDLTMKFVSVYRDNDFRNRAEEEEKAIRKVVDGLMKTYKEGNIDQAIYSMNEISFKCKKYYLVDDDMWDDGFYEIIRGNG